MLTGSWQDHLRLKRLQTHEVVTGLSRGGGDDWRGERGKGKMRQPRVKDKLSLVKSIETLHGAEHRWVSRVGQSWKALAVQRLEYPAKNPDLSHISFFLHVGRRELTCICVVIELMSISHTEV